MLKGERVSHPSGRAQLDLARGEHPEQLGHGLCAEHALGLDVQGSYSFSCSMALMCLAFVHLETLTNGRCNRGLQAPHPLYVSLSQSQSHDFIQKPAAVAD